MKRYLKLLALIFTVGLLSYFLIHHNEDNSKKIEKENTIKKSNIIQKNDSLQKGSETDEIIIEKKISNNKTRNAKKEYPNIQKSNNNIIINTKNVSNNKSILKKDSNKINTVNWKRYQNTKVGYSIKIPSYWKKNGDEVKVIDLKGKLKAINVNFKDTILYTSLLIKYFPNPNGKEIYRFKLSQFKKSTGNYKLEKKEIFLDGNKAILGSSVRTIDGKGHKLKVPLKIIFVDLLSDRLKGELEFQFITRVNDNVSVKIFDQILETFKIQK